MDYEKTARSLLEVDPEPDHTSVSDPTADCPISPLTQDAMQHRRVSTAALQTPVLPYHTTPSNTGHATHTYPSLFQNFTAQEYGASAPAFDGGVSRPSLYPSLFTTAAASGGSWANPSHFSDTHSSRPTVAPTRDAGDARGTIEDDHACVPALDITPAEPGHPAKKCRGCSTAFRMLIRPVVCNCCGFQFCSECCQSSGIEVFEGQSTKGNKLCKSCVDHWQRGCRTCIRRYLNILATESAPMDTSKDRLPERILYAMTAVADALEYASWCARQFQEGVAGLPRDAEDRAVANSESEMMALRAHGQIAIDAMRAVDEHGGMSVMCKLVASTLRMAYPPTFYSEAKGSLQTQSLAYFACVQASFTDELCLRESMVSAFGLKGPLHKESSPPRMCMVPLGRMGELNAPPPSPRIRIPRKMMEAVLSCHVSSLVAMHVMAGRALTALIDMSRCSGSLVKSGSTASARWSSSTVLRGITSSNLAPSLVQTLGRYTMALQPPKSTDPYSKSTLAPSAPPVTPFSTARTTGTSTAVVPNFGFICASVVLSRTAAALFSVIEDISLLPALTSGGRQEWQVKDSPGSSHGDVPAPSMEDCRAAAMLTGFAAGAPTEATKFNTALQHDALKADLLGVSIALLRCIYLSNTYASAKTSAIHFILYTVMKSLPLPRSEKSRVGPGSRAFDVVFLGSARTLILPRDWDNRTSGVSDPLDFTDMDFLFQFCNATRASSLPQSIVAQSWLCFAQLADAWQAMTLASTALPVEDHTATSTPSESHGAKSALGERARACLMDHISLLLTPLYEVGSTRAGEHDMPALCWLIQQENAQEAVTWRSIAMLKLLRVIVSSHLSASKALLWPSWPRLMGKVYAWARLLPTTAKQDSPVLSAIAYAADLVTSALNGCFRSATHFTGFDDSAKVPYARFLCMLLHTGVMRQLSAVVRAAAINTATSTLLSESMVLQSEFHLCSSVLKAASTLLAISCPGFKDFISASPFVTEIADVYVAVASMRTTNCGNCDNRDSNGPRFPQPASTILDELSRTCLQLCTLLPEASRAICNDGAILQDLMNCVFQNVDKAQTFPADVVQIAKVFKTVIGVPEQASKVAQLPCFTDMLRRSMQCLIMLLSYMESKTVAGLSHDCHQGTLLFEAIAEFTISLLRMDEAVRPSCPGPATTGDLFEPLLGCWHAFSRPFAHLSWAEGLAHISPLRAAIMKYFNHMFRLDMNAPLTLRVLEALAGNLMSQLGSTYARAFCVSPPASMLALDSSIFTDAELLTEFVALESLVVAASNATEKHRAIQTSLQMILAYCALLQLATSSPRTESVSRECLVVQLLQTHRDFQGLQSLACVAGTVDTAFKAEEIFQLHIPQALSTVHELNMLASRALLESLDAARHYIPGEVRIQVVNKITTAGIIWCKRANKLGQECLAVAHDLFGSVAMLCKTDPVPISDAILQIPHVAAALFECLDEENRHPGSVGSLQLMHGLISVNPAGFWSHVLDDAECKQSLSTLTGMLFACMQECWAPSDEDGDVIDWHTEVFETVGSLLQVGAEDAILHQKLVSEREVCCLIAAVAAAYTCVMADKHGTASHMLLRMTDADAYKAMATILDIRPFACVHHSTRKWAFLDHPIRSHMSQGVLSRLQAGVLVMLEAALSDRDVYFTSSLIQVIHAIIASRLFAVEHGQFAHKLGQKFLQASEFTSMPDVRLRICEMLPFASNTADEIRRDAAIPSAMDLELHVMQELPAAAGDHSDVDLFAGNLIEALKYLADNDGVQDGACCAHQAKLAVCSQLLGAVNCGAGMHGMPDILTSTEMMLPAAIQAYTVREASQAELLSYYFGLLALSGAAEEGKNVRSSQLVLASLTTCVTETIKSVNKLLAVPSEPVPAPKESTRNVLYKQQAPSPLQQGPAKLEGSGNKEASRHQSSISFSLLDCYNIPEPQVYPTPQAPAATSFTPVPTAAPRTPAFVAQERSAGTPTKLSSAQPVSTRMDAGQKGMLTALLRLLHAYSARVNPFSDLLNAAIQKSFQLVIKEFISSPSMILSWKRPYAISFCCWAMSAVLEHPVNRLLGHEVMDDGLMRSVADTMLSLGMKDFPLAETDRIIREDLVFFVARARAWSMLYRRLMCLPQRSLVLPVDTRAQAEEKDEDVFQIHAVTVESDDGFSSAESAVSSSMSEGALLGGFTQSE